MRIPHVASLVLFVLVSHALAIGMLPRTNHRAFAEYSLESLTLTTTGCDRAAVLDRRVQWMCADTTADLQAFVEQWDALIANLATQDAYAITPVSDWFVMSGEEAAVDFYGRLYDFEGKNLLVRYQTDDAQETNKLSLGVGTTLSQLPELAVPLTFGATDMPPVNEEDASDDGNLERLGSNLLRNVRGNETAEEGIAGNVPDVVNDVLSDERVSAVVEDVETQLSNTPLPTAVDSIIEGESTLESEATATANEIKNEGEGLLGNITNAVGNAVRRTDDAASSTESPAEVTEDAPSSEGGRRFGIGRIPNPFARDGNDESEMAEEDSTTESESSSSIFEIIIAILVVWFGLGLVREFFRGGWWLILADDD